MIIVGIDIAKDKHDCFIMNSENEVLFDVFTIPNTLDGFNTLLTNIKSVSNKTDKIKVGLESTGHYGKNLLGFLLNNNLTTYVLNPLHMKHYRQSQSLRKTKTDKIDARAIASMLMSRVDLKPYTHGRFINSKRRNQFQKKRFIQQTIESIRSNTNFFIRISQIMFMQKQSILTKNIQSNMSIIIPKRTGIFSKNHI